MDLHVYLHMGEVQNKELTQVLALLREIISKEDQIMSQITDWAAAEQVQLTAISTTLDTVVAGIAALDVLITNFQNSPGTLSPSDQAALDGIQAASAALVTKSSSISVNPPVSPVQTVVS